ncbi:hypothetical protein GGQ22_04950 [Nocardioides sp. zg-579]|uniref:WD40 repeat domain-containing protein n=1 Tax=Nocardioides marmotae TaxID=2663857 RepID=A0A6I3JAH3_9ACTN|nr:hypothetical protein [Nocardioides marmotae]MCR6030791.1 hypothetical protein [Gordonia jinghuaiqii]MTB94425.1 hypothetical protein [Nocardioides marmotae]QKE01552.1 hypothetical protein HPC71_11045 [Nocardioides marmotae]
MSQVDDDRWVERVPVRRRSVAAWCGTLLAATGCSAGGEPDTGPPPAPERSTASPTSTPSPPRALDPIPDALRLRLPTATVPIQGAIDIDLMSAVAAPTVDEAPVGTAMLLAQLLPDSTDEDRDTIRVGHPYLMTRTGDWRQLDLQRYGFGAVAYLELSTAISSDGRKVALADPSGLVTVDLQSNGFRRYDLPVDHAVALEWSADGATLFLKDRTSSRRPCGPKGCALDVTTGDLGPVPYDLFHTTHGGAGQAFEVKGSARSRPARIITHHAGGTSTVAELGHRTSSYTAGGPAAGRHVAFSHCSARPRARDNGGVVVVEPSEGTVVAMLANGQGRQCQLVPQAWLTDRTLLVDDWSSGDLWLWDVPSGRVSTVATSRTPLVHVQVAREVMAQRFAATLRP